MVPARAAASAKPAASKPLTAVSDAAATDPVFINVGLFADADNARRAYVKLVLAGLPAERRVLMPAPGSGKGKLTRVRAGPFASRAQALAAVPNIKELELDAVIAP